MKRKRRHSIELERLVFVKETGRYQLKTFTVQIEETALDWLFQKAMNNAAMRTVAMHGGLAIEVKP